MLQFRSYIIQSLSCQYIVPLDKLFPATDSLKDSLSYDSRLKGIYYYCDTNSSDDFPVHLRVMILTKRNSLLIKFLGSSSKMLNSYHRAILR